MNDLASRGSEPIVDPTACDREPIHIMGQIQPLGFLIAVSMDWIIQHVSANIASFVPGCDIDALPGEHVSVLLREATIRSLQERLAVLASNDGTERIFGCDLVGKDQPFDVSVHISGHSILIEAEPSTVRNAVNPGSLVKTVISRLQRTRSREQLYRECVRQLRAVTGFDRVMLYHFGETGSGTVIAEAARDGLEPYLGLHYPASDIPAQARALYVRNPTRGIADIAAVPVAIIPPLSPEGNPVDLSLSVLRSVSPIHVEYLANMGVAASFSISIVIDDSLWGLFALHHCVPRHVSMEMRSAIELFGQTIGFMIEARLSAERQKAEEAARELHDRLIGKIVAATGSIEAIADYAEDLQSIIACDGLTVWANGEARSVGKTPPHDELPALARFLNRAAASRVYSTDELASLHLPAEAFLHDAAGVLAIPISRSPRDYVLFFRQEIVQTVTWAGNPSVKQAVAGTEGQRLSPRKSFAAWQETVRGKAIAWSDTDRKAAEALRISLLEVLLRFSEEAERQRAAASQRQELLIAELNHRVRNILGLMRALVVQSRPGATTVDDFAKIIGGRIQALGRAHDQITSDDFSEVSLRSIIETEVQAYIGSKASRVTLEGPDIFVDAKAFSTLALVFHEMVTNSAKYGALCDHNGGVSVEWRIDPNGFCRLDWVETGGPTVQPPQRRGFGSTIIERSIPHDLEGTAIVRYLPKGLEAEFTLPPGVFNIVQQERNHMPLPMHQAMSQPAPAQSQLFAGLHGLIVEDNMIIALDAEQLMLDGGMAKVHLAASVAEARKIIATERLDIALLDVNLGPETSFPLVTTLNEKKVPFVFVTGYGERVVLPPEAGAAVAIKKPFATQQLTQAIIDAMGARVG